MQYLKPIFKVVALLSITLPAVYLFAPKRVGSLEARYDIFRGHYEVRSYGLMPFTSHGSLELLLRAYGVDCVAVAGCLVNDFIIDRVEGYNSVMRKAILEKYAIDIEDWKHDRGKASSVMDTNDAQSVEQNEVIENHGVHPLKILVTPRPESTDALGYSIGSCFQTMQVDIDSDEAKETICLRTLESDDYSTPYTFSSVIIDVFKDGRWILRQELDRSLFYEEQFVSFRDIDDDGKDELITSVGFGPNCAGMRPLRIYKFNEARFELIANLLGILLQNRWIGKAIDSLHNPEKTTLKTNGNAAGLRKAILTFNSRSIATPWLLDSDRDGYPEIYMLVSNNSENDDGADGSCSVMKLPIESNNHRDFQEFKLSGLKGREGSFCLLGFLATTDHHIHMLINHSFRGTGTGSPVLHIFDIQPGDIKRVNEFSGFYEHTLFWRLRDANGDGNTDIVCVKGAYWPSGKPHADMVVEFGIAIYENGQYVELIGSTFEPPNRE